ncbi:diacylglycerol kinase theta isoform X2 [Amblyraja radiata]|uniref:diacylglycerol kinase theta isoform X2 n=1 Tax=Amblyraja radiata TaxID=386614 RepID=UPI001402B520|nr:diacylglycerol kinase theta isoform X2 [Amblyraja radiata]
MSGRTVDGRRGELGLSAAAAAAAGAGPRAAPPSGSGIGEARAGRRRMAESRARLPRLPGPGPGLFPDSSSRRRPAHGHRLRKVTLTKPSYCQRCTDFIWGLGGFQCDLCNFMCHEKCVKNVKTLCSCLAANLVKVPVAHSLGAPALYKRKFCVVCRRQLEESRAMRCEVCELHVHVDCSPFACSDCRRCHQDGQHDRESYHHHWREGNLLPSARCDVCKKACGSSEVLSGFRCEWCGITVHADCYSDLTPECNFGRLQNMILPPDCVRVCARSFSKFHSFRISEHSQTEQGDEESGEDDDPTGNPGSYKDPQPPSTTDSGKQTLKIFDGNDTVKRNQFRLITVPRISKIEEAVEAALRIFYIPGNPQDYKLQVLSQDALLGEDVNRNGERVESRKLPVFRDTIPEAWVLRAKPTQSEVVRIYPEWLKFGVAYISIPVTMETTVRAVIQEVLPQLGLQDETIDDFQVVEVYMGCKQVQRVVLTQFEYLLCRLQDIRKLSVRQMNQTRFYITKKQKSVVQVKLLLMGLPHHLSQDQYFSLLTTYLDIKRNAVSLSYLYADQGAVVLEISCFAEAERIYMLVRDTTINDKQLSTVIIPDIQASQLPLESCPLLLFVNPKSGSLKGCELLHSFRKLLNPHQVFDLTNGGPLPGVHTFRQVPCFRIVVCGGDGTVGWVLGVLDEVRHKLACTMPPVAVLPLGTGNDLARVLRWGPGYTNEDPFSILVAVDEAEEVLMDRWTILLDGQQLTESTENGASELEPPKIVHMNNYCGLGIDAELSLDFHQARLDDPGKFNSRFHNKGMYVKVGLQKISHTRGLHKEIKLQVDDKELELPSIEGLIFLNIPSWGSGADLWGGDSDGHYDRPRIDDGMLEVVGVTGVVHMGQVQSGLRSGIRIAQGTYFRVTLLKAIPLQVDGEPWIQSPGIIIISAAGPKVHMLKKCKQKQKKHPSSFKDSRTEISPASEVSS